MHGERGLADAAGPGDDHQWRTAGRGDGVVEGGEFGVAAGEGGRVSRERLHRGRRARGFRCGGLPQDAQVQPGQVGSGVGAEVIAEHPAHVGVGVQRLSQPATGDECGHQQADEALVGRVAADEAAQFGDGFPMPADLDLGCQASFLRDESQFDEVAGQRVPQVGRCHVLDDVAAPEFERGAQGVGSGRGVGQGERGADGGPELERVDVLFVDVERVRVAAGRDEQAVRREHFAEPRDADVDRGAGPGRRLRAVPRYGGEPLHGDGSTGVQREHG